MKDHDWSIMMTHVNWNVTAAVYVKQMDVNEQEQDG